MFAIGKRAERQAELATVSQRRDIEGCEVTPDRKGAGRVQLLPEIVRGEGGAVCHDVIWSVWSFPCRRGGAAP